EPGLSTIARSFSENFLTNPQHKIANLCHLDRDVEPAAFVDFLRRQKRVSNCFAAHSNQLAPIFFKEEFSRSPKPFESLLATALFNGLRSAGIAVSDLFFEVNFQIKIQKGLFLPFSADAIFICGGKCVIFGSDGAPHFSPSELDTAADPTAVRSRSLDDFTAESVLPRKKKWSAAGGRKGKGQQQTQLPQFAVRGFTKTVRERMQNLAAKNLLGTNFLFVNVPTVDVVSMFTKECIYEFLGMVRETKTAKRALTDFPPPKINSPKKHKKSEKSAHPVDRDGAVKGILSRISYRMDFSPVGEKILLDLSFLNGDNSTISLAEEIFSSKSGLFSQLLRKYEGKVTVACEDGKLAISALGAPPEQLTLWRALNSAFVDVMDSCPIPRPAADSDESEMELADPEAAAEMGNSKRKEVDGGTDLRRQN
ncbi:MAG: hypothetical protein LBB14_01135, partial [Puniceicoccales bacterium]|nr:hypothetical protein [Puniceicoccales bacterium]